MGPFEDLLKEVHQSMRELRIRKLEITIFRKIIEGFEVFKKIEELKMKQFFSGKEMRTAEDGNGSAVFAVGSGLNEKALEEKLLHHGNI